jgi:hypothetical protein
MELIDLYLLLLKRNLLHLPLLHLQLRLLQLEPLLLLRVQLILRCLVQLKGSMP